MKITVEGRPITVDDSFAKLSPVEQDKTVDEIAKSLDIKPGGGEPSAAQIAGRAGAKAVAGGFGVAPMVAGVADAPGGGAGYMAGADLLREQIMPAGEVPNYRKVMDWLGIGGGEAAAPSRQPGAPIGPAVEQFQEKAAELVGPKPTTPEGRIAEAALTGGIEAIAGSGLFRVAGRIFSSYPEAAAFLREVGAGTTAQGVYGAAAAGGGQAAEEGGLPPIVGTVAGLAAAAGGHAAGAGLRAAPGAVRGAVDDVLKRSVDSQETAAAARLRGAAHDRDTLDDWARRGDTGELVPGSKPSLFEATDDRGIGAAQRQAFTDDTGGYQAGIEEKRADQNAARLAEIEAVGGPGRVADTMAEFRRQRDELDRGHGFRETVAQTEADVSASRAGTSATAEEIGAGIRDPMEASRKATAAEGGKLYDAIGAEGVTVGTGRLKAAIGKEFAASLEKPLSADEKYFADLIRGYPTRLDFNRLQDLRSEVVARGRQFQLPDTVRRRFRELKVAIDAAMDEGLQRAVQDDPTLFQRTASVTTGLGGDGRQAAAAAMAGGGASVRGPAGAGTPRQTVGRSRDRAGGSSLPPISEFIAKHGGLPLDAESAARDWGNTRIKGKPLAHTGGRSIDDYWRQTLMEEGYLPPDDYHGPGGRMISRNVDDEVRRLLENELGGGKRPDLASGRPLEGPEADHANARSFIADRLKREGEPNPDPRALDEAARMYLDKEETHPTTAYERALTQGEAPAAAPPTGDVPLDLPLGQRGSAGAEPVDAALTQQQREANAFWREYKQTYGNEPILKQGATASGFAMGEEAIPKSAFRADAAGGARIRALKAAGAPDAALAQAAAYSMMRTAVRDGAVDAAAFRRWRHNYGPAIAELPADVQRGFQSAADAAATLERVTTERIAAMREFDKTAVGEVLGVPALDLEKSIGTYLRTPSEAHALANAVANNPAARDGLRRLMVDHILGRYKDASDVLSKAALTKFITQNKPALSAIFGQEGAQRWQRLADDIERSRKQMVTGKDPAGPSTAADIAKSAAGATVMSMIAKAAGPKGMVAAGVMKAILSNMKLAGMADVDQLFARALLDPELARRLLTKAPALKNANFRKGLGTAILRSATMGAAYGGT